MTIKTCCTSICVRNRGGGLQQGRWPVGHFKPENAHTQISCPSFSDEQFFFLFFVDWKFCMSRNTVPPQSNLKVTTAHRNIPSSFSSNTLNWHAYTHKNAGNTTCCSSFLCHLLANKNQHWVLSLTLRQWTCVPQCVWVHVCVWVWSTFGFFHFV